MIASVLAGAVQHERVQCFVNEHAARLGVTQAREKVRVERDKPVDANARRVDVRRELVTDRGGERETRDPPPNPLPKALRAGELRKLRAHLARDLGLWGYH